MNFEEARQDYINALDELNRLITEYNNRRQEHPKLGQRHRLQTVPAETWCSHLNELYTPKKMRALRDGPLDAILSQSKGSTASLQDVVKNAEPSLVDRLLDKDPPQRLNEEAATLLSDIHEQGKQVERITNDLERLADGNEFNHEE